VCCLLFIDRELSLSECTDQLANELCKSKAEQDLPAMKKLWNNAAMFESRRQKLSDIGDGCVKEIATLYPLLQQMPFVSKILMYVIRVCVCVCVCVN
jgi:hypothetical protein